MMDRGYPATGLLGRYPGIVHFLRRLAEKLPPGLVLDVGSGHDPHPRAHVLCDKSMGPSVHRLGASLVQDERPLVIASVEALPFKDKSFGYAIASHVLEHVSRPDRAVRELCRVARQGYIETPSLFAEKLHSSPAHRWYVALENGRLVFMPKERPVFDQDLTAGWEYLYWRSTMCRSFQRLRFADTFLVRFRWSDDPAVEVRGPLPEWNALGECEGGTELADEKPGSSILLKNLLRRLLVRRQEVKVESILCCPVCKSELSVEEASYRCVGCGRVYPLMNGVPVLLPPNERSKVPGGSP